MLNELPSLNKDYLFIYLFILIAIKTQSMHNTLDPYEDFGRIKMMYAS